MDMGLRVDHDVFPWVGASQSLRTKSMRTICELLGDEDRIVEVSTAWNDGLVVNRGNEQLRSNASQTDSAWVNTLMVLAIMANTRVSLKEPFNYDGEYGASYSMVELKTLQVFGKDQREKWRITSERRAVIPGRLKIEKEMEELGLRQPQEALANISSTNGICCLGERELLR